MKIKYQCSKCDSTEIRFDDFQWDIQKQEFVVDFSRSYKFCTSCEQETPEIKINRVDKFNQS